MRRCGIPIGALGDASGQFPNAVQHCGARVYGLELGVGVRIFGRTGWWCTCQVARERLLFEVVVNGLVSAVRLVDVIVVCDRCGGEVLVMLVALEGA